MSHSGRSAATSCACISVPQQSVYCTVKAKGQPWTQSEMTSLHKWDLDAICWHRQTGQKLNIYTVRECSAADPCEKQLGTRGFIACERTVWAEERAPGVAAIVYVDRGTDEEFRKGGARIVNSVVYGGIYTFMCFNIYPVTGGLHLFSHRTIMSKIRIPTAL